MNFKALKLSFLICFEYIKRNSKWFILALLALSVLLFVEYKFGLFFSNSILRIGLVGTYQEHDIPQDVTKLLSRSMVKPGSDGKMNPDLVEKWEVNTDATEFKFTLKDGLYWVDGTKLTAGDLSFAIPNSESTVLDEKTIQFKLKESYSPFPSLLTKPVFKKGTLTGTGPYRVEKVEKSKIFITKLTLVSEKKGLPVLNIRFYPSESVARTGFNMGEVAVLMGFSNQHMMSDNPQVKLKQEVDYSKVVVILFSTKDALLSNRSVRQALSFATPVIEGEQVANNPYPAHFWVYDPNSKKYLANMDEAKKAINRAKSSVSEDKLKGELVLTTTPNLEEVAKKVENAWKALGFDVKLRVESGVPQNFQAMLITQGIPQDPDQYFLWHSTQEKTNQAKYSSLRVDKDLEEGRKALSDEDRKNSYFDFQRSILEDAPATFLYFPKHNIFYLKKVEGLLTKILSLTVDR